MKGKERAVHWLGETVNLAGTSSPRPLRSIHCPLSLSTTDNTMQWTMNHSVNKNEYNWQRIMLIFQNIGKFLNIPVLESSSHFISLKLFKQNRLMYSIINNDLLEVRSVWLTFCRESFHLLHSVLVLADQLHCLLIFLHDRLKIFFIF